MGAKWHARCVVSHYVTFKRWELLSAATFQLRQQLSDLAKEVSGLGSDPVHTKPSVQSFWGTVVWFVF